MTGMKSLRVVTILIVWATTQLAVAQESGSSGDESVNASASEVSQAVDTSAPRPVLSETSISASGTTSNTGQPQAARLPSQEQDEEEELVWDYEPYRVLAWIVSDDPKVNAATLDHSLRTYLERDFGAVWRLDIADAPVAVQSAAVRDLGAMTYDTITSADPVLAVKRDHADAVRIRIAKNVGEYVKKVYGTKDIIAEVKRMAQAVGNETVDGVDPLLDGVDGDALMVRDLWSQADTEAILIARGMALTLTDPEAKLMTPTVEGLVGEIIEQYDKVFIVRIQSHRVPGVVSVVELDTLMRHFGPIARTEAGSRRLLHVAVGRGLTAAFAPVVRIENAGQKSAVGLLRAGGLVLPEHRETSPAYIRVGDVLEPMVRKDDRNGKPIVVGPMDWAYLLVSELAGHDGRNIEMDFYAGRAGGLQGRKNKRTFRMALKVRQFDDTTLVRLHLQKNPKFPLIGYELYEKDLDSTNMTFVGRTDWDGRFLMQKSDQPLRLLYVKNGGAVLARLPLVPGLYPNAVADLSGDDMRLQAEAYIRGVQNSIVDLVAIRELFKARIRLRLERGEMKKAEELLNALRDQPSSESLYDDIGKRHTEFINELGSGNANQRRKIDEMFSTTRELLAKHITPKLVRDLEADVLAASKNGGRLPVKEETDTSQEYEAPTETGNAEATPSATESQGTDATTAG